MARTAALGQPFRTLTKHIDTMTTNPTPPAGSSLTQEQKNILIAEACGWTIYPITSTGLPDVLILPPGIPLTESNACAYAGRTLPAYFHDLNACHEMEEYAFTNLMDSDQKSAYAKHAVMLHPTVVLSVVDDQSDLYWEAADLMHSGPELRAEAFGLTLNLWTNS